MQCNINCKRRVSLAMLEYVLGEGCDFDFMNYGGMNYALSYLRLNKVMC